MVPPVTEPTRSRGCTGAGYCSRMFQDPLSLVPYAVAAGGGYLEDVEAPRLVTAGLTLLQRSAPLVRALSGRSAAMCIPDGVATLLALAAGDGRAMHVLPPATNRAGIEQLAAQHGIGALFTCRAYADDLPDGMTVVLLDEAPWHAEVRSGERVQRVDLGSHHGVSLIGDTTTPGRDEPFVVVEGTLLTHEVVLREAREAVDQFGLTPVHSSKALRPFHSRDGLIRSLVAPLLAGGRVEV